MRNAARAIIREVGVETGGSNIQFAVDPETGRLTVDRDEPAGVPQLRPGQQGHRVPHRQDRGPARHRLPPGRDPERHHQGHPGLLRARHRLRGGEDPALGLREVPRRPAHPGHPDEVGGGGHGHRPDLQGGPAEGPARPGDRHLGLRPHRPRRRPHQGEAAPRRPRPHLLREAGPRPRLVPRRDPPHDRHRPLVPGPDAADRRPGAAAGRGPRDLELRTGRGARGDRSPAPGQAHGLLGRAAGPARPDHGGRDPREPQGRRHRPRLQAGRHLRGRVRVAHALPLLDLRARGRGRAHRPEEGGDPGQRPQPHRAGDRVRLLLLPRQLRPPGRGLRDHHGQLQPGDGLHRLRHLRPAVLRAPGLRRRHEHRREGEAGRGGHPVRGADPAAPGGAPAPGGGEDPGHQPRRGGPGGRPQALQRAPPRAADPPARERHRHLAGGGQGGRGPHRLPRAGAAELRAGRPRHGHRLRRRPPRRLRAGSGEGLTRASHPRGSLPGGRLRGRRGRPGRRRARGHRGDPAAHRGSGDPQRRLGHGAAHLQGRARPPGDHPPLHPQAGPGPGGARAS